LFEEFFKEIFFQRMLYPEGVKCGQLRVIPGEKKWNKEIRAP
jgi:hypothetical protein